MFTLPLQIIWSCEQCSGSSSLMEIMPMMCVLCVPFINRQLHPNSKSIKNRFFSIHRQWQNIYRKRDTLWCLVWSSEGIRFLFQWNINCCFVPCMVVRVHGIIKYTQILAFNWVKLSEISIVVFNTGGTETHLILVDLRPFSLDSAAVEFVCEKCSISVNKNSVPGDKSALKPGRLRLGNQTLASHRQK